MKLLLTGATGFIGGHVLETARALGHTVIPLTTDLRDSEGLKAAIRDLDYSHVLHLAGLSFVGNADAGAFYAVNLLGTLNLLEALLQKPPHAVVLSSSANVYGNCQVSPIAETQPAAPTNHYAMSKLAMEHMARTYEGRLNLVFARLFNSTGPGQSKAFLIPKLISHFQAKTPLISLGNLDVEREFNDIRMTTAALLGLLNRGAPGNIYNVCSGVPYALRQVLELLCDMTGHRPEIQISKDLVRANEVRRLCGNPEKIMATLGPLPLFRLEDTLTWMLEAQRALSPISAGPKA